MPGDLQKLIYYNSDTIVATRRFEIANITISAGERKHFRLRVSTSFISNPTYIPVTILNGKKKGPVVLIIAAIHGDELNGIEIVRLLSHNLDFTHLSGTIICVPVVNIYGFQNLTRYLPEGRDLNRTFPGSPDGWAQERYAHIIFTELVRKSDYVIDLHTASEGRINLPHIRAEMSHTETARIARAFGTTVILNSSGYPGTLRRAALEAGIPAIVFEAGETRKFDKKIAEKGVEGVLNLLRELKMFPEEPFYNPVQFVVDDTIWIRVDRGGILLINTRPGKIVKKNQEIAANTNPFGVEVERIRAPFSGIIMGIVNTPTVNPGQGICHISKLTESRKKLQKRLFDYFGKKRIVF